MSYYKIRPRSGTTLQWENKNLVSVKSTKIKKR